jgi:hypothetical protein
VIDGTVLLLVGALILAVAVGVAVAGLLGGVFGLGAGLVAAGVVVNLQAVAAEGRALADRAQLERERAGVV